MEENTNPKRFKLNECDSPYFETKRMTFDFFNVPCVELAKNLLGAVLVRKLEDGVALEARIVETECYPGSEDKASHSFSGKRTPRNEPMYMKAGTIYVYKTYGMYHCFNISSRGEGAAVLVRSVEPIVGLDRMTYNRLSYHSKRKNSQASLISVNARKNLKPHELCNGPSKLCISFDLTCENCNKHDLCTSDRIWIEKEPNVTPNIDIVSSTRIGIQSAGAEWANKLFRFYIKNNASVSVRDKQRESVKVVDFGLEIA